jgi:hypothetical protein
MRIVVFGALAAAAVAPAQAADPIIYVEEPVVVEQRSPLSGHIEAYLGGLYISQGITDDTLFVYGGAGRLNWAVNDRWNVQGDVFYDRINNDNGGGDISGLGGALHAYWRNPDSFALGVWGSYTGFDAGISSSDVNQYRVGPEFQIYAGNWTIYGQGYFGELDLGTGTEADLWGARGVVRYFAHENLRFDGEVGYHTLEVTGQEIDTLTLALQGNYRFTGTPLTVFGRYQYDRLSSNASIEADLHKFIVGVRGSFGSDSLLDEDRHGATMDTPRNNIIVY